MRKKSNDGGENSTILEVYGNLYFKINVDGATKFTTGLFQRVEYTATEKISKEDNANLLEKAGFVTHDNYIPFLGKSHAAHTRKADAEHRKVNGWM